MKLLKQVVLLLAIMLAMAMPVSVYAAGEGNIDNGGGGKIGRASCRERV